MSDLKIPIAKDFLAMSTTSGESCQFARSEHFEPSCNMDRAGPGTTDSTQKRGLALAGVKGPSLDEWSPSPQTSRKSQSADRSRTSEPEACGRTAA